MNNLRFFVFIFLTTFLLSRCSHEKTEKEIVVLHTNDVHSRIEPFFHKKTNRYQGGFALRASLIKQIKSQYSNVLLFDAGDFCQGTPYFNYFKGTTEIELMNYMGYDAAVLGNHEFDNGIDGLKKIVYQAQFPFIVSNYIFDDDSLQKKIKKYKVFNFENVKIGVFGLGVALKGLVNPVNIEKVTYLDPITTLKEMETLLKEKHQCDVIICLSHLGLADENEKISDRDIAKASSYLNLIIGGHTHKMLTNYEEIINQNQKKVFIGQVGYGGSHLGYVKFSIRNK